MELVHHLGKLRRILDMLGRMPWMAMFIPENRMSAAGSAAPRRL
jgi:hypothetical protein